MLERFEKFTFSIYEIQRCWNKIASEGMERYGLKGSYAIYLIAMRRFPGGITSAELGSVCNRDKADVSRAVSVLESKGIVMRDKSDKSYRAKLFLTNRGAEMTEQIAKKAEYAEKVAGDGLSDADRINLYHSLERIMGNMVELAKQGIPASGDEPAKAF